jgi:hypothetical protein
MRYKVKNANNDGYLRYRITLRSWILMVWTGEVAAADWCDSIFSNVDEALPWNAKVKFFNRLPVLYIGNRNTGTFLWPDGTIGFADKNSTRPAS